MLEATIHSTSYGSRAVILEADSIQYMTKVTAQIGLGMLTFDGQLSDNRL